MNRIYCFLALLLFALFAGPGTSAAQSLAQSLAQTPAERVASGEFDAARQQLRGKVAGNPQAALHLAFLEALIARKNGRLQNAVAIYREILLAAPDYEPARRELTIVLAQLGQYRAALYQAERVAGNTDNRQLRARFERFIASQSQGKPAGTSFRFDLSPSSNVNGGTTQKTVYIAGIPFVVDEASRAKSGTSVALGVTAWRKWRISEQWSSTLLGSGDYTYFAGGRAANSLTLRASLISSRSFGRTRVGIGPKLELLFQNGDRARDRIGLSVFANRRLSQRTRLSASLEGYRQRYAETDYRDGNIFYGQLEVTRVFSPSLTGRLRLLATRETTGRKHLDHTDLELSARVQKEWQGGLSTALDIGFGQNRYKGDYPGAAFPREDQERSFGVSLWSRKISFAGFAPRLSVSREFTSSNIGFFDRQATEFGLTFSQQF